MAQLIPNTYIYTMYSHPTPGSNPEEPSDELKAQLADLQPTVDGIFGQSTSFTVQDREIGLTGMSLGQAGRLSITVGDARGQRTFLCENGQLTGIRGEGGMIDRVTELEKDFLARVTALLEAQED